MTETPQIARPHRVLFLAPNWLGDAVMSAPLLNLLHRSVMKSPPVQFDLVLGVRRPWAPLFRSDPRIAELLEIDRGGDHSGLIGFARLVRQVREGRFSAIVLGPPSLHVGLVAAAAGIPLRVGYRSDGRGWLLNEGLRVPRRGTTHYSREMVDLGEALLGRLGVSALPAENGDLLPGCVGIQPLNCGDGPPVWVVAPGATYGLAKTWPLARVREFIHLAVLERGVRICLLGDDSARGFAGDLSEGSELPWRDTLPGGAGVVDLIGATDLSAAVAVLKSAEVFVGNDSGLMHVAGALGLATVGVFGSSSPAWTSPLGPRTRVVVAEGFPCQPCFRRRCNQSEFCLDVVTGTAVMSAVDEMLTDRNATKGM